MSIGMVEDGRSMRYVAEVLGVSASTIQRTYQRYRDLVTYTRRPGFGHRRAKSARDDRFLRIHNRCRSKRLPGTSNWSPCKCLDSKEKTPKRWSFSKKTSHGSLAYTSTPQPMLIFPDSTKIGMKSSG
ncbi:hypothetical protein C0J52_16580 [Blattella germanica]|nr:hypothetical protein C0J52_16580 [Blattella germanica]